MERAFSTIAVKSLDDDQREFFGMATSPVPDRVLDVIDPLGVKYRNPLVLLRAHDHQMPIGECHFDRPTKAGITFRAKIPKIAEPGLLKDRVDMAWGEIRHGLVKAVSVGFRPLDTEALPSGGLRFKKSEVYELSTVAVPAQELATIDHIKAIDAAIRQGGSPAVVDKAERDDFVRVDEVEFITKSLKELTAFRRADSTSVLYTQGQHKAITEGFGMAFAGLAVLRNQLAELAAEVSQQGMSYKGVWRSGTTYPPGCFVTHGGSMWHCDKQSDFKPGEGGGWTLAVRKGKDFQHGGRD